MRPFLRHGQRLLCEKGDLQNIRAGDLVVFAGARQKKLPESSFKAFNKTDVAACQPDSFYYVVHRVRRLDRSGGRLRFLTRGDNVGKNDGWIDSSQVIGAAVARINPGGVKKITSVQRGGALLLAPLLFRMRELAIRVLAFCMCFVYPYIGSKYVRYVDTQGVICVERRWLGWPVCRRRSSGRAWVHPVFARTTVLRDTVPE